MSFIVKIPGADFSNSGLPKLSRTVMSFPAANLQGLWLAQDGAVGAGVSSLSDSAGNNNTATLMSDFVPPVRTSAGLQSVAGPDQSFIFDSGIKLSAQNTAIICAVSLTDSATTDAWEAFMSDTQSGIQRSKSTLSNVGTRPSLVGRHDKDGTTLAGNLTLLDRSELYFPTYLKIAPTATYGLLTEPFIYAHAINNEKMNVRTYSGFSSDQEIISSPSDAINLYADAGNFCFGHWRNGSPENNQSHGVLYAAAYYDKALNEEEMTAAMAAMAKLVRERGVAI